MAPMLQYNAHPNVGISVVAAQSGSVEYCGLTMRSYKYFVYVRDHRPHRVTGRCALYLARNLQYSGLRNDGLSPIAAQIRSIKY
jgi:hypothetical protein